MSVIINGDTGISGVDGSAATPSFQGTDTNTGIFYPAADTIAFAEGGTEVMRIDSSGNVGIGTTSPGAKFEVNAASNPEMRINDGTVNLQMYAGTGTSSAVIGTVGSHALAFRTNATERMRIDSSGIITGTAGNLMLVQSTSQATTSGTSIDFTSIPSWVKRITVMLNGVSTSGTSNLLVQLGDAGGIENTGYTGSAGRTGSTSVAGAASSTAGATITNGTAATDSQAGTVYITNVNSNNWIITCIIGNLAAGNPQLNFCGVAKSTSDTLTQVRITTVNGTDTFDAGSINILYE